MKDQIESEILSSDKHKRMMETLEDARRLRSSMGNRIVPPICDHSDQYLDLSIESKTHTGRIWGFIDKTFIYEFCTKCEENGP